MPATSTPWPRIAAIGVALAAVVTVIVLAFSWPTVTSEVKNLPVAISGPDAAVTQVTGAVEQNSPGTFDFTTVADRDAAVTAIEKREVYGAIIIGQTPEVLTASAAGTAVSQILTGLAAAQGATVTDVVPLADSDPRGVGLAASAFPLTLGGMLGGILISTVIVGAWRRLVSLFIYVVVGGAVLAGVLQGLFGALQGAYLVNAGAISLALLAMGATIVGFSSLVGRAGIAIGPVLFLLIANPISSANAPLEFLVEPWGAIGQFFPPGAIATLLRDLSYFPHTDVSFPWLTLAIWAAVGVTLGLVGHFRTRIVVESEPELATAAA